MKKTRIQLSFSGLSDSKFLSKANTISSSMKNNATIFKDPQPTMEAVDAAIAAYSQAFYAADGGSRQDVDIKNKSREALESTLFSLGLWVMFITDCTGIIALSGFTLVKQPQPRRLEGLNDVSLSQGISSGEIDAQVPKGNATSFSFEIADALPDENTTWKIFPVSTSQYTFSNLVPGKQYYIRVGAVGNRKQLVYSNVGTQNAKL